MQTRLFDYLLDLAECKHNGKLTLIHDKESGHQNSQRNHTGDGG